MASDFDVERITANREEFNSFVYMPVREAMAELDRRQASGELDEYVAKALPKGMPEILKDKKSMVLFRHIATSNYEMRRFVISADALDHLQPVFMEYLEDRFTNRNEWKYYLGRICLSKGINKKNEMMFECSNIIDFNSSNNKPISAVSTSWGQSLVDFHHELFTNDFPKLRNNVVDISRWLHEVGPSAKEYYKPFLTLFLKDAILFDNFLTDTKEGSFTKEVILPTIRQIVEETGMRPLIVALEPTDIEGDKFWLAHPLKQKELLEAKSKPDVGNT
jgi:hypothetical protein